MIEQVAAPARHPHHIPARDLGKDKKSSYQSSPRDAAARS
jgi:hypothetical protein